jgi:hypothetical protein
MDNPDDSVQKPSACSRYPVFELLPREFNVLLELRPMDIRSGDGYRNHQVGSCRLRGYGDRPDRGLVKAASAAVGQGHFERTQRLVTTIESDVRHRVHA